MKTAKAAILKMFLCFPSARTMDQEQAAMMAAAYLETVQSFSSEIVCAACDLIRRRSQAFPPSAGELYDECNKVAEQRHKRAEWEKTRDMIPAPRLPPPPTRGYTADELGDFTLIINAPGRPYVSREVNGAFLTIPPGYPGEGKKTFYGYLTPREMKAAQSTRAAMAEGKAA